MMKAEGIARGLEANRVGKTVGTENGHDSSSHLTVKERKEEKKGRSLNTFRFSKAACFT